MTIIDTDRLRALANAATPGPWEAENRKVDDPYVLTTVYNVFHNGETPDRDLVAEVAYDNAEFIAATDPQTVLELLDRIDQWEERYYAASANLRAETRAREDAENHVYVAGEREREALRRAKRHADRAERAGATIQRIRAVLDQAGHRPGFPVRIYTAEIAATLDQEDQ